MAIIRVDEHNIEDEHICCAISDKKGENCVGSKKAWMKERFKEGLIFQKLDQRGKVFVEYMPAEHAFAPIVAPNYMYINCFWVSGKYKGQGHANALLEACVEVSRSKGKSGLVVLSSKKKMPFLSDPQYLKHKGFVLADAAEPYYELLYLPFHKDCDKPQFTERAKSGIIDDKGMVLYYTNQCPHTDKYVPIIEMTAKELGLPFKSIKLETSKAAQNAPCPFTTYSLYMEGKFFTNEILSETKFRKLFGAS